MLCLAPTAARADLGSYHQDFEGLVQSNPGALAGDGWLVFGNVFTPTWGYIYGYGPFPAPNGGAGFCGIDINQGGPAQGAQQLVVYNDYNNGNHQVGNLIEANVFRQTTIGAADVGAIWVFSFDAKRGNIAGTTTALAFIKTLDPNAGYAMTNFLTADMTSIPDSWGSHSISITIDAGLVGQILQYGFASTTTGYQGSGIFYDNVGFARYVPASVFVEPRNFNTNSRAPWVTATIELTGFDLLDIDVASLRLGGVVAPDAKFAVFGDRDGDLVPDLTVRFSYPDVRALLPVGPSTLELTGALWSGETFATSAEVKLIDPPNPQLAASVAPNPLNPAGVLEFRIAKSGPVSVRMFDLNGRLVRTLFEGRNLAEGTHRVQIDGRGAGGASLPSGVYFYRVETPEGVERGQFSILK
ncbi:MAG TPA: T9SS type A sorting domain-containing protein [Acidobacteriota bacterium]|nr:T9SS type A sorting domain-containing protein [Acidobacteriota bacterium]